MSVATVGITTWVKADEADKPEPTFLAPSAQRRLIGLLEEIAEFRRRRPVPIYSGFHEEDNIYLPVPNPEPGNARDRGDGMGR
jgi:hypothetical protein